MPSSTQKYYRISLDITKRYQFEVPAESEEEARKIALERQMTTSNIPSEVGRKISSIKLEAETEFNENSRVKHFIFGAGTIKEIKSMQSGGGPTFLAKILFDNGDVKEVCYPSLTQDQFYLLD